MPRHRIVVLLLDQVLPLDFAIPLHVFGREASEFYTVKTATRDGAPVAAAGGLSLVPDGDISLLRRADTVVVPGYVAASSTRLDQMTLGLLRSAARHGTRMVSICSGTFALAQAGLIDGLTVTTHWSFASELAEQYPSAQVEPGLLFVDNDTVLTSGGVTSGIDLCLHMLRKDLGPAVANHVARRIVMAPRREGDQAQFIEPVPMPPGEDILAATQQWMLLHLDEQLTVAQMAGHARMSARHFHRRFHDSTGRTPIAWLHEQRIARAKELLETTDLTVEIIASRVGLGSPANLRSHFRRATSISPTRHRQAFSQTARRDRALEPTSG
jgi:transcriptional regulator GlxA family with amidase domain